MGCFEGVSGCKSVAAYFGCRYRESRHQSAHWNSLFLFFWISDAGGLLPSLQAKHYMDRHVPSTFYDAFVDVHSTRKGRAHLPDVFCKSQVSNRYVERLFCRRACICCQPFDNLLGRRSSFFPTAGCSSIATTSHSDVRHPRFLSGGRAIS